MSELRQAGYCQLSMSHRRRRVAQSNKFIATRLAVLVIACAVRQIDRGGQGMTIKSDRRKYNKIRPEKVTSSAPLSAPSTELGLTPDVSRGDDPAGWSLNGQALVCLPLASQTAMPSPCGTDRRVNRLVRVRVLPGCSTLLWPRSSARHVEFSESVCGAPTIPGHRAGCAGHSRSAGRDQRRRARGRRRLTTPASSASRLRSVAAGRQRR
jgi:hypothetical protein